MRSALRLNTPYVFSTRQEANGAPSDLHKIFIIVAT